MNGRVSKKFWRRYPDGSTAACSHAETDALLEALPGDRLFVVRWSKDGQRKIAKPCRRCEKAIRKAGVICRYTDENGNWRWL